MRFAVVAIAAIAFAAGGSASASECKCRAPGKAVELGETLCLATPRGPRLATCGLVLNNTAWHFSDTPCVVSRLAPVRTVGLSRRRLAARIAE